MNMATTADPRLAGTVAFQYPDFVFFQMARFFIVLALEMQSVAVGWQVYEITRKPLDLGLVGLAQFLPGVLFMLASGHAVDRLNRKRLLMGCYAGFALCSGLLLAFSVHGAHSVYPIYGVVVLLGTVRSFNFPTSRAILPQLVPEEHFANAVAWNSSVFQGATILGPSVGGLLYAFFHGAVAVYGTAMGIAFAALVSTLRIKAQQPARRRQPVNLATILAGFRYIWEQKLILGSISLDVFAVLLGGAVALLPVYAREILKTGPWGLGLLRSAPGAGAAAMAILLAHRPLKRNIGKTMLWCVAGFGVFTIVFGLSRNLYLSLVALLLCGASDMVSVFVRMSLVQLRTPDEMRGRVSAVNSIFIGTSNQLGEFESGVTARLFGTVPATLLGGIGTLVVVAAWAVLFPSLRRIGRLEEVPAD